MGVGLEDCGYALEVFFGVYADGVVRGFGYVEGEAVFEQAKLFETFGLFEVADRQRGEALKRSFAVGIEAEVLPDLGVAGGVAVEGDGGAREVEGAAVEGGDYLYGVRVGDVLTPAGDFEGRDFHVRHGEWGEDGGDVFGLQEGFVALDVDVDVGVD